MSVLDLQALDTTAPEQQRTQCDCGGSEVSLLLCDSTASVLLCL